MKTRFLETDLSTFLVRYGIQEEWLKHIYLAIAIISLIVLCFVINFISRQIILRIIATLIKKSKNDWDDILLEKKVFNRLSRLAPVVIVYIAAPHLLWEYPSFAKFVHIIMWSYAIFVIARTIDSLLSALNIAYERGPNAKFRPITSYVQVAKILSYFICFILILSIIFEKSVGYFFTGLGAVAAVLMLVFKDSILGLVAGIQLTSNKMLQIGDWITAPKHGADGAVIEISLHTVKIQNGDKTIVTIPTYALISESFQNSRGIAEAGVRRIKRHITIDINSISFLAEDDIRGCANLPELKQFFEAKRNNQAVSGVKSAVSVEANISVFRQFLKYFLNQHPEISNEHSQIVRQLQPTESGLPIEVIAFCTETDVPRFEEIQAEFFEFIIAALKEFKLDLVQIPTGRDMRSKNDAQKEI